MKFGLIAKCYRNFADLISLLCSHISSKILLCSQQELLKLELLFEFDVLFLHERAQLSSVCLPTKHTLRDRGSLLFLLGERREEPLLATARFFDLAAVHGQGRIN